MLDFFFLADLHSSILEAALRIIVRPILPTWPPLPVVEKGTVLRRDTPLDHDTIPPAVVTALRTALAHDADDADVIGLAVLILIRLKVIQNLNLVALPRIAKRSTDLPIGLK